MRLLKDDLRELDLFSEASRSELTVIAAPADKAEGQGRAGAGA